MKVFVLLFLFCGLCGCHRYEFAFLINNQSGSGVRVTWNSNSLILDKGESGFLKDEYTKNNLEPRLTVEKEGDAPPFVYYIPQLPAGQYDHVYPYGGKVRIDFGLEIQSDMSIHAFNPQNINAPLEQVGGFPLLPLDSASGSQENLPPNMQTIRWTIQPLQG